MMDPAAANEAVTGETSADPAAIAHEGHTVSLGSASGIALMTATVLASAVGSLDANVVKAAVPAIGRDLDASITTLQWILTSYLLVVAALLLLAGALADGFGRRRVLVVGLLVMLISSVLCALAPSPWALIGIWAGLQTLATTVGPYAGGWLIDHAS